MRQSYEYIERCVDVIGGIDPVQLATNVLSERPFDAGSTCRLYRATMSSAAGRFLALKVPNLGMSTTRRVCAELTAASLLAEYVPDLACALPSFMGLVAITATVAVPKAIITEDASHDGQYRLRPGPLSRQSMRYLRKGFKSLGEPEDILHATTLKNSMTFQTSNGERLLDFTPGPFTRAFQRHPVFQEHQARATEAIAAGRVTVAIPAASGLAENLVRITE